MKKFSEMKTIGVVGAGGMGEGIALNFAQAGLSVHDQIIYASDPVRCDNRQA